ncbi:hypothetical protein IWW38_000545 [Coemansia aciculifera]|uniref:Uncharacterized protein n=1 Tax=Coemansia aciculifera TaxID=417176 RepID=A0ACC1M8V6_9FUNG|nr:hypothetical protein IWW38_000545 [Coemansia aciculifera]
MATLEKLARLSEPSIQGARLAREIVSSAKESLSQSQRDYAAIYEIHPKLGFLIADNQVQAKLCASLIDGLTLHLADIETSVTQRRQQAGELRKDMAMVIELLKSREVVEREFRCPPNVTGKHTLYDHIDQDAVDELSRMTGEGLEELEVIAESDVARCKLALEEAGGAADLHDSEDISVTWSAVGDIKELVEESGRAAAEIAQDSQSMDHHCDQLRDTIRDLEADDSETGDRLLSLDDYNVLLRDTDEIPMIVADLREVLADIQRRAEEINVRYLQYSAFYQENLRKFAAIARISAAVDKYVEATRESQVRYVQLLADIDSGLEDTWSLVSWYRNFHSAYDSLIAEVHRRRHAQKVLFAAVEDMRSRLDGMYLEEMRLRTGFVEKSGPFLPSDLCPFIQDPPASFVIEEAEGERSHQG